jgi:hypothetical protein
VANVALNSGGSLNLLGSPHGHLALWAEQAFHGQQLTDGGDGIALILEILLFVGVLAYFVEGIRGTFAYYRYKNDQAASVAISN